MSLRPLTAARSLVVFSLLPIVAGCHGRSRPGPRPSEPASLSAPGLPEEIVAFGDSLTDDGNMFARYGIPASPPDWHGRFSDGPVWIEHVATKYEATLNNYAYGGATTGHDNELDGTAPGLLDEIKEYRIDLGPRGRPAPKTIFALWIGPNDFASATSLAPAVLTAMENIKRSISRLFAAGARKFLVLNAPNLAQTPHVREQGDPELSQRAEVASIAFNSNLAWTLAGLEAQLGIDVVYLDVFTLLDAIVAAPTRFGFTDAENACVRADGTLRGDPADFVFWDGLHPTTKAHALIAQRAVTAIASGGDPLPDATASLAEGLVLIESPAHGEFPGTDTVQVSGSVIVSNAPAAALTVNGTAVPIASDGTFSIALGLGTGDVPQPITAEVFDGQTLLDRDRIVVFRGPAVVSGQAIDSAVTARLTTRGLADVRDLVLHELIARGPLDLRSHLFAHNPIASDFGGTFQYVVNVHDAGYACSTLELVPLQDRIRVRLNLHDVFVDWNVHAWLQGIPDPGFDCWGRVTAGMFSVYTDIRVQPAALPGEVSVTQLTPLTYELAAFSESHDCDFFTDIAAFLTGLQFNVQQRIESAIQAGLASVNRGSVFPQLVENAIARVSLSRVLGTATGALATGDVTGVALDPNGLTVEGRLAFDSAAAAGRRTYAVPQGSVQHTGIDPVTGQPYDFAVGVAFATLNQLLLTRGPNFLGHPIIDHLDLGGGSQPLTAGALATLIPGLSVLDPNLSLELRARGTLPPMLTGQSTGAATCDLSNLYLGQLLVELHAPALAAAAPLATIAVDVEACLTIGYDASAAALTASVSGGSASATLVDNPLRLQAASVEQLVESLGGSLVSGAGALSVPLPTIGPLQLDVRTIAPQNGHSMLYFDARSSVGRPDLVVAGIQAPPAVDRLFPFGITFDLANRGTARFDGGLAVASHLSLDSIFDAGDPFLGSPFFSIGPLDPGQSVRLSMTIPAMPWAADQQQTLFLTADPSPFAGGAGAWCETDERNNLAGVQVLTTLPDAYVAWVSAPSGGVGGGPNMSYRVRVGRNDLGIAVLAVPITVTVGNPTLTFGHAWVDVPRGQEVEIDVWVPTPSVSSPGGQVVTFPVTACQTLAFDSNRGNDCASTSVGLAAPYWDLAFSISGPGSTGSCSVLGWDVTVRNVGNVWSPNVCAFTTLSLSSGPRNYASSLQFVHFSTPPLSGGASWTFHVRDYAICNAFRGTQFLKAEINYSAGCYDNYNANENNFAEQPIWVW